MTITIGGSPATVVVGGANVDVKARSSAPAVLRTSNPGSGTMSSGGVARNVAENLARLGSPVHLLAAVGQDPLGERLLADTAEAGVRVEHVHRSSQPTGTYTAVLDADGELVLAVADMAATDQLRPEHLWGARGLLAGAGIVVLDGNLPAATAAFVLDLASAAAVRAVLEPVSVPKAATLAGLITPDRPLFAVTPNRDELAALTGGRADTDARLGRRVAQLHDRGVEHVWVRLGVRGSLLSSRDGEDVFLPAHPARVVDVTGAGDAMLGAFVHALLLGREVADAARFGHAAAALTVGCPHTVRPDLTHRLVEEALAEPTRSPR